MLKSVKSISIYEAHWLCTRNCTNAWIYIESPKHDPCSEGTYSLTQKISIKNYFKNTLKGKRWLFWKNSCRFTEVYILLRILLLGTHPKRKQRKSKWTLIYKRVVKTLFTESKNWKERRPPSNEERLNKLWCMTAVEYYFTSKNDKRDTFREPWPDTYELMQSQMSGTWGTIYTTSIYFIPAEISTPRLEVFMHSVWIGWWYLMQSWPYMWVQWVNGSR